jgi:hypothetical protein
LAFTNLSTSLNIPRAIGSSSGTMAMYMRSEAEDAEGLSSAVMPLFFEGYEAPSGELNLFLEASNQCGLFGLGLGEHWGYYDLYHWTDWPTCFDPAGFTVSEMNLMISGTRIVQKYAVMPLFVDPGATGTSSGFMALFTKNYQTSTEQMTLSSHGYGVETGHIPLYMVGAEAQSAGTMTIWSSGMGATNDSITLYIRGFPSGV